MFVNVVYMDGFVVGCFGFGVVVFDVVGGRLDFFVSLVDISYFIVGFMVIWNCVLRLVKELKIMLVKGMSIYCIWFMSCYYIGVMLYLKCFLL